MVLIHKEEIIKISPDFFCRLHRGIDIKFRAIRERRENAWKHARLNLGSHTQFCTDPFLFSCNFGKIIYIDFQFFKHIIE